MVSVPPWLKVSFSLHKPMMTYLSVDATGESRYAREPACDLTPERLYERRWAMSLFEHALDRLREQYLAAGKARQYDCLNEFLSKEAGDGEYLRAGAQLEMSTGAVSTAVHRLRQSYRALVREEVARTVASQAEVEAAARAAHITPVPGGVGAMTIVCLMRNTLIAAALQAGLPVPKV